MTTKLDPQKIAQLLTQGTRQLNAATVLALADARRNALQRQAAHSPVFSLATGQSWTQGLTPRLSQPWLIIGLLAAALIIGTGYWHHAQEQQISDLDVAILTDDLPIELFID